MILPILTYGGNLFTPTAYALTRMTVFWNKVLRWITNCFSSTPVPVLALEACIPPLFTFFLHMQRTAALRIACTLPEQNPATARLPLNFPSPSPFRTDPGRRFQLSHLFGTYKPKDWDSDKAQAGKAFLPIDHYFFLLRKVLLLPTQVPVKHRREGDPPLPHDQSDYPILKT